ncbi:MAG: hypothetical protein WC843_04035 [Candidatus Gracilibacteria bacterium]|jgi:hypothetical protein
MLKNTSKLLFLAFSVMFLGVGCSLQQSQVAQNQGATQTQGSSQAKSSDQISSLKQVFLAGVPKVDFAHLNLADFPSVDESYSILKPIVWNNKVFVNSNPYILEYDLKGNLLEYANFNSTDCGRDLALINDSLYVACNGKGIYEIDLNANKVSYFYTQKDGLKELRNLQFAVDADTLWVGTFEGVAKIDTKAHKATVYGKELNIGGSAFGSNVYAHNGQVWVVVGSNAYNNGGISNYDKNADKWDTYQAKDLKEKDLTRLDVMYGDLMVADQGVYAIFQDGGPENVVLKKFDSAQKKWTTVYHDAYLKFNKGVAKYLPPVETYRNFDYDLNAQDNSSSLFSTIRVFLDGKWVSVPIVAKKYVTLSTLVKGTYYLLSASGIDSFTEEDAFPKALVKTPVYALEVAPRFFVTGDQKYVVYVAVDFNAYGGTTDAYSVGIYDTEIQKFYNSEIKNEKQAADFPQIDIEKAKFSIKGQKIMLPADGDRNLVIDLVTKKAAFVKN